MKAYIEEYKNKLTRQDQKYQLLKEHAEEKLEEANKEIDNISRSQVNSFLLVIISHLSLFVAGYRGSQADGSSTEKWNEGQKFGAHCGAEGEGERGQSSQNNISGSTNFLYFNFRNLLQSVMSL